VNETSAQTFTFEAAMTVILVLVVIILIIQAVPLTPLTSSAANAQVENTLEIYAEDVLNVLTYEPQSNLSEVGTSYNTSILKEALLYWGTQGDAPPVIYGGASGAYYDSAFSMSSNGVVLLKQILINAFEKKGIAYNIEIYYRNRNGGISKLDFVENGYPSDNAVVTTQIIPIYITDKGFERAGITNYIPDVDGDSSPLYNVLEVKLIVWKM